METQRRKLVIRLSLVIIWVGLGILLFVLNRGHTLLVDNRNVDDLGLRAPDLIKVTVNRRKPLEFLRGSRDIFNVGGGRQRIYVEFSDGRPPFETRFKLPLGPDMFLLSIPKMIHGIEPYIEVFITQPETRNTGEEQETTENFLLAD